MKKYLLLENKNYEILEHLNGDCYIKDKRIRKYYFKPSFNASQYHDFDSVKEVSRNIVDVIFDFLIVCSVFMLLYIIVKNNSVFSSDVKLSLIQYIYSIIFLVVNIVLHEFGHYITLRIFSRRVDKIGFKMNFIFPAIYVNTSDSYLLPRNRRIYVYYSGILINIFLSFLIMFCFPTIAYIIRLIIWSIMLNLLPFGSIRTDGYHILFSVFFNVKEFKNSNNSVYLVTKYTFIVIISVSFVISIIKLII